MKVILTGSTGFVGREVLRQCCNSSQIQSIIVLSRRPLPESSAHAKITSFVVEDFTSYSDEVTDAISDADGCIWSLGKAAPSVEIEYPMAFTRAMTQNWSQRQNEFRYVHCSGVIAEKDQSKSLWYLSELRRAKGQAETALTEFALQPAQKTLWQTYIMRPSLILSADAGILQRIAGQMIGSVRVDEIARCAIRLALKGNSIQTLENDDLVELSRTSGL